jgi:hypothetical protein
MYVEGRATARETAQVADPTVQAVLQGYLRVLLGGRTRAVLGRALEMTPGGAGHLLNGTRQIDADHLQRLALRWGIATSTMMRDIAQVAHNLQFGLPLENGISRPESVAAAISADAASAPPDDAP